MKQMKLYASLMLAALTLTAVTSCKTTEENYKNAYEVALEKHNEGYTDDEIKNMAHEEAIPKTVYKGDSIPLKGAYVSTVKLDPPVSTTLQFNVVVATFKQKFNATSVMNRLKEAGYEDARLLIDRDQTYYVAATTSSTISDAVASLKEISAKAPISFHSPCPYILRKP
jgi:hypothetical protein